MAAIYIIVRAPPPAADPGEKARDRRRWQIYRNGSSRLAYNSADAHDVGHGGKFRGMEVAAISY